MTHLSLETLNLFLDGQLDANARIEAQAHLASCARCQRELNELRGVFASLAALELERLPFDLAPRVVARIAQPAWRSPFVIGVLTAQSALAVLLAMLIVPTLVPGWANLISLPTFPSFDLQQILALATETLVFTAQDFFINLTSENALADVNGGQWLLAIGFAGMLWLVANRFLLNVPHGTQKEIFG